MCSNACDHPTLRTDGARPLALYPRERLRYGIYRVADGRDRLHVVL